MTEQAGRTIIGSVVFIDIVRYSKAPDSLQLAMKARLNAAIAEAVAAVASQERVILDTGDGAAICFLGDPEDALFAATAINEAIRKASGEGAQELRTGINLGPIKLVTDLNGRTNVVGDGVNVAQRIMSFADVGEILVSRSYYEVVARLREGNERLFRYMGSKRDKHVREHQLYAFGLDSGVPAHCQPASAEADEPGSAERADGATGRLAGALPAALLAAEERRLAAYIGPLARVIVRRAAESARSIGELCSAIAEVIPDPADRASFLAAAPAESGPEAPAPLAGDRRERPPAVAAPAAGPKLSEAELSAAEHQLARCIGPLAGVLVRQAARAATDRRDFYARLSASIANPADRAAFLATVPA
jgi:hypothetical protein